MAKIKYDPSKRIYGILYASTTALFWGFLAIFIKITIVDVAPVTIVWFRFSVAFLFLSGYFLWKDPKQLLIFRKPPPLIIVAALGLTLNYIGFAMGILYTSPGNSQIFIQLGPILLAVSGIVIFKERLSLSTIVGFFGGRRRICVVLPRPSCQFTGKPSRVSKWNRMACSGRYGLVIIFSPSKISGAETSSTAIESGYIRITHAHPDSICRFSGIRSFRVGNLVIALISWRKYIGSVWLSCRGFSLPGSQQSECNYHP